MFWGIVIFLVFFAAYIGQCISSGMNPEKGRLLQWACWLVASGTMTLCYFLAQSG